MEKDIIVLDHISLLKSADLDGERIQKLSHKDDRMFRVMSSRRERIVIVKRIFNTKFQ